jgi:hypothetical protein
MDKRKMRGARRDTSRINDDQHWQLILMEDKAIHFVSLLRIEWLKFL